MIRQLSNYGFKDQKRTIRFSGLDFFTSNDINGVGKSAVLEAFKLALIGEVPGRAKNVEDILQFTSLDEMKLEILADTRQGPVLVERSFLRQAARGEMRPIRINHTPRKYEEGCQWIRQHIGSVSISFDPFEFLNLSDSKKRQWIIAHSPESQHMSRCGLFIQLLARLVEKYLGPGVVRSLLISEGISSLEEVSQVQNENSLSSLKDRLVENFHRQEPQRWDLTGKTLDGAFHSWSPSQSAEQNSNAMLAQLKSEILRLKNAVRQQTAALFLLKSEGSDEGVDKPQEISGLKEEIQGRDQKIQEIAMRIQTISVESAEATKKDERIRFLQENVSRLADYLNADKKESLENTRKQWQKRLVDTKPAREALSRLKSDMPWLTAELKQLEAAQHQISGELKLKRDKRQNLSASHFACPVAEQIRCETDMNPYREILDDEIDSWNLKAIKSAESYARLEKKVAGLTFAIAKRESELMDHLDANLEVQRNIDILQDEIRLDEKETAKVRGMVKAYREEWNLLESDPFRIHGEDDFEALEQETRALKFRREAAQKVFDGHLRRQGKMQALSQLNENKKQLELELEIVKQIADEISDIQEEMVSHIAGALETEVNEALGLIDSEYEFILNLHGKQFEMGWNRDGITIPFKTINSAHFVIFMVPFLAALMKRLDRIRKQTGLPTLKALCIEAESLTPGNLAALLKGLSIMKRRMELDNVLVAHYHTIGDPEKLFGFQEHILEAMESSVIA